MLQAIEHVKTATLLQQSFFLTCFPDRDAVTAFIDVVLRHLSVNQDQAYSFAVIHLPCILQTPPAAVTGKSAGRHTADAVIAHVLFEAQRLFNLHTQGSVLSRKEFIIYA